MHVGAASALPPGLSTLTLTSQVSPIWPFRPLVPSTEMRCPEVPENVSRPFCPGVDIVAVTDEVGYAESHTVFTLLRKRTGLTPTELLPLSDDRLRVLMSERLPLVEPHCEDRATGDRHRRGTARPQRLE